MVLVIVIHENDSVAFVQQFSVIEDVIYALVWDLCKYNEFDVPRTASAGLTFVLVNDRPHTAI